MWRQRNLTKPVLEAPRFVAPSLAALHRHTVSDWRRIFATQPELAVAWIQLAARSGFKAAQLVLGQMHLDGQGVARDPVEAYAWFTKAATIGSAEACNMVGRCHELGWGVPVDQAEAFRHYSKAAEAGLSWGHYNVGCLLLYGTGVRRDHRQAVLQFQAAAAQGHAKAMGLLGRCHEEGWGVPVDKTFAGTWYARAAEGGDCWGAFNLGLMQVENGATWEAVTWLERAVATATPNCLAAIVRTLAPNSDPRLRGIALKASDLMQPASQGTACDAPTFRCSSTDAPDHSRKPLRRTRTVPAAMFAFLLVAAHILPSPKKAN